MRLASSAVPRRLLAICSTGGHLDELLRLVPRLSPSFESVDWATFDTPQSRSLLAGERVSWVHTTRTRDARHVLTNLQPAAGLLLRRRPDAVISTGAGVAFSFLPLARALGIPAHYVESATRLDGPSSTGRALALVPGVRTYTQHASWADRRWLHRGSVLDAFARGGRTGGGPVRRVVVVLGTNPYGFRRLLERLVAVLPPGIEVLWQTGVTDTAGLPIQARAAVPADELHEAMTRADVIVAHAGMGTTLAALAAGRIPVLVPRRADRGEQIDDHQVSLAEDLAVRGLAVTADADDLTFELLTATAPLRATTRPDPPEFVLA